MSRVSNNNNNETRLYNKLDKKAMEKKERIRLYSRIRLFGFYTFKKILDDLR